MITLFKLERRPISQTAVDEARKLHQEGYCIWCDAYMHSQRTVSGEWRMVCHDGYRHTNPICDNMYQNRKTVLEWRNEDWETIFGAMDHEDPPREEPQPPFGVPPTGIDINNVENPTGSSDGENPGTEDIDIIDIIDINNVDSGPDEQLGKGKEPVKIIHRPPRTMREVIACGVLFLINLGAMISGNARIGDYITSWIDRRWMFIAIFASLLHINSGFLCVPNPSEYHAFQFIPTNITRGVVEGTMWFRLQNHQLYINLRILIDPSLSSQAKKRLGGFFAALRSQSMASNLTPKNDYDHFIAKELLVASGKWRMVSAPANYGKYSRVTFETTIKSKHQLACCKGAMKWITAQGERFNDN